MRTGIAVCTFNRLETLKYTISRIRAHTKSNYELVVVDDGSSDGTPEEIGKLGVKVLSPRNRGIAWNKNRALFYLKNFAKAEAIIVMEDDTFPLEDGWEKNWIRAIAQWGHINLAAHYWGTDLFHGGDGTPERPYKSIHVSAQCSGFSSKCLEYVGYMDSRFRGWGMEHVEHTDRLIRAGFGGEPINPTNRHIYYVIDSNLEILFRDESVGLTNTEKRRLARESLDICVELSREKIKRDPWLNDEEMAIFLSEFNLVERNKIYFHIKNDENKYLAYDLSSGSMQFTNSAELCSNAGFKRVMSYYDGHRLRLCTRWNGKIEYMPPTTVGIGRYRDDPTDLEFDVVLDRKSGMYLKRNGLYMSCEKAKGHTVSVNRTEAGDWERFYFSHFENDMVDLVPRLIDPTDLDF